MRPRTIRLPEEMDDQISRRALVNRRSVNNEIIYLLEKAIDASVKRDLESLKQLQTGSSAS